MARPIRPLHLAVAIDGPEQYEAPYSVELARLAERGALDFVTLDDYPALPEGGGGRLDALAVLTRVATATDRIGLVPAVTTTHTEPFHVSPALATLDRVSRGRAGWTVKVPDTEAGARHFGRRPTAPDDVPWREAGEAADVAARLGDSWEDDAEIRDLPTGCFIDRDKVHHADFEGERFGVRGPSTVPRPPQGRPVMAIDATPALRREVAALHADVAYIRVEGPDAERQAHEARADLRRRAAARGRDPDRLTVLISLAVALYDPADAVALADLFGDWHRDGAADGFHVRPADPRRDTARLVDATVPVLQQRGLFRRFQPGTTLREHLGLDRPDRP
ncbi:LLM class flavin-dependent oxidoreductase [Streptomyces sp. H10-C2]|uniref:LLM class flavin-dependent oxidoreductase n=1 Tax=unclassified Streptomyces TaxID=2593676 RepID=UPI0024B88DC8|nr:MULTISPECIES: LLM class flavin-dependent oxidoreductase [unclassified Streptomyces]MDJ0343143.1 LLM class flavin-dependent oxidoreductase [Streptomyces sp. PH10-H1]MDJ0371085.1 LLM class flavin-dependent oxidoreductase [Streptomyces sp. H10-C2]